jgi:hypothetical protein
LGFRLSSEEELATRKSDYPNVPEDEYVLEVVAINVQKDQVNPYNNEKRDTLQVRLRPISFTDGTPAVYEDGSEVDEDKLIFDFIDPTKTGMKPQPAKARKFITACKGVPLGAGLEVEEWSELVGSRVLGLVSINDKGQNRVTSYRPLRRRPARAAGGDDVAPARATPPANMPGEKLSGRQRAAAPAPSDEDVKADNEDLLAAADRIFNDDEEF